MKILNYNKLYESSNLQTIDETSLNRLFDKHFKDVRNAKYSFIPVYGGFIENKGTDSEVEVQEPALLVPNQKVASNVNYDTTDELKELGISLCKKYNQDSFLFKPQNDEKAYYIDKNGNVDMTFTGKAINDLTNDYFTKLHKNAGNKTDKRFTFTENKYYINHSPKSLSEAQMRYGEKFFSL